MSAPELADVLFEEWRRRVDEGESVSAEDLIDAHPEAADELRERFDAVRLLEGALADVRPPRRIGDYRILREIGRGGMGVVYEARQESLDRRVAVKVLYPSVVPSAGAVRRFRQEAQAAGRLKHTNIVAVYALGEADGLWYCAMELVDGPPLATVLDRLRRIGGKTADSPAPSGPPSTLSGAPAGTSDHYRRVARMFAEVADALETAHEAGVVHRDVKPSNLLLDASGHLRLADFGLALLDGGAADLTRTGVVLGTPLYMSPEQFKGQPDAVGPATDVYSLGATLYEVLTLRPPHEAKETARLAAEVLTQDPPPLRSIDPRIPRDLETVCAKALEKELSKRYATAAAFAEDLRSFAEGNAVRARRTGPLGRFVRRARRHPARVAAAALLLAAVVAVTFLGAKSLEDRQLRMHAEYDLLLRRAVELRPEDADEDASGSTVLYDRAIAIDDRRPDAYVARALVGSDPVEDRLRFVGVAQAHGVRRETAALLRAYVLIASKQPSEGEAQWSLAGEAATSDEPLARLVAGMRAARADDLSQALDDYDRVLRTAPPESVLRHLALTRRVEVLVRTGDHDRALEDVLTLKARGDDRIRVGAFEAVLWRRLGKEKEAETRFETLLARALRSEGLCVLLATTLEEFGIWTWLSRTTEPGTQAFPESAALWSLEAGARNGVGDWSGAIVAAERAMKLSPGNAGLEARRAGFLGNAGRREDALSSAEHAVASDPKDPQIWLALAVTCKRFDLIPRGGEAAERALQLDPRSVEGRRVLALLRIDQHRLEEAETLLREALRANPRHPGVHHAIAALRMAQGRPREALEAMNLSVALEPENPERVWARGRVLSALELHPEAADAYRRAVTLRPTYLVAWESLGHAQTRLKNWGGCIEAWTQVLALDPKSVKAWNELGVAYRATGDLVEADKAFRKALEADPKDWEALGNRAGMLVDAGHAADALPLFDRIVEGEKPNADTHYNRGLAREEAGKLPDALEDYRAAAALNPRDPGAHVRAGVVLLLMGNTPEAVAELEKAAQLGPDDASVHFDLAETLRRTGDMAGAKKAIQRSLELRPSDADAHAMFSDLLAVEGDRKGAVEQALIARDLAPNDFRHARNAVASLEEAGQYGAAADALLLAAERFPDRAEAHFFCAWYLVVCPDRAVRAPAKAVEHARKAIDLDATKPAYQMALGAALCATDRFAEGIRALEDARVRDPATDPQASYFLAMALHRTGKSAEAKTAFERAAASRKAGDATDTKALRLEAEAAEVLGTPPPK